MALFTALTISNLIIFRLGFTCPIFDDAYLKLSTVNLVIGPVNRPPLGRNCK